jgi:hypothetical protein
METVACRLPTNDAQFGHAAVAADDADTAAAAAAGGRVYIGDQLVHCAGMKCFSSSGFCGALLIDAFNFQ